MAYSLPEELENILKREFPQTPIKNIVHRLFELIVGKTTQEGSCHIRQFGKYLAYKTYSTKTGKNVIRFKYKISSSLNGLISEDDYILNNIPSKTSAVFDEQNEEVCKDKKDSRKANLDAQRLANKFGKEGTKKKVVEDEVMNILSNTKLKQR